MHAGVLDLGCSSCHGRGEAERRDLGCDPTVAAAHPVWQYEEGDAVTTFMNCPSHFIPERVWNFWKVYKAYQQRRAALPDLDRQPLKYLGFCDVYEGAVSLFQGKRLDQERAQQAVSSLGKMRFGHG